MDSIAGMDRTYFFNHFDRLHDMVSLRNKGDIAFWNLPLGPYCMHVGVHKFLLFDHYDWDVPLLGICSNDVLYLGVISYLIHCT